MVESQKFECYVISVDKDSFIIKALAYDGDTLLEGHEDVISMGDIHESERSLIVPGAVFDWAFTSEMKFRVENRTKEQIRADMKKARIDTKRINKAIKWTKEVNKNARL